jgi:hypothetical protein
MLIINNSVNNNIVDSFKSDTIVYNDVDKNK